MPSNRGARIILPRGFVICPARSGGYKACQPVMDGIDRRGWRLLTRQMLCADYVPNGPPYWQSGRICMSYAPVSTRIDSLRHDLMSRVEPLRRAIERRCFAAPGSPRSHAPRFDEDSLYKIVARLGAMGVWIVLWIVLSQTQLNIATLPPKDADVNVVQLMSWSIRLAKPFAFALTLLLAVDLAVFVGRRLWGHFGFQPVITIMILTCIIVVVGYGLFGSVELSRLLNTAIERADIHAPADLH